MIAVRGCFVARLLACIGRAGRLIRRGSALEVKLWASLLSLFALHICQTNTILLSAS